MKRIITAFLLLLLVACSQNEFIEGKFSMAVEDDHPIWDIWLQDTPKDQKESAKKEFLKGMTGIVYSFESEEHFTVEMITPEWVQNPPPTTKNELLKKEINGKTVYVIDGEDVAFLFEKGMVYLIPENRLNYKIPLKPKI